MSPELESLANQLADVPFTARQHTIWVDVCREVIDSRHKIGELEKRLKTLEHTPQEEDDPLKTVLTRPEFNREVARMLAFDERYGGLSSVLYFDIENLDAIVSDHGRSLADSAVRCVSDTLLDSIRRSDILGRLAADEFGVLLPRCNNQAAWKKGEKLASEIYKALARMNSLPTKPSVIYGAYTFREKESLAIGLRQAASSVTKVSE